MFRLNLAPVYPQVMSILGSVTAYASPILGHVMPSAYTYSWACYAISLHLFSGLSCCQLTSILILDALLAYLYFGPDTLSAYLAPGPTPLLACSIIVRG